MSRYLLDSDTLSALFDTASPSHNLAVAHLAKLNNTDAVGLSIITLCELEYSQWGFNDLADQVRVQQFIERCKAEFAIVNINLQTAELYGKLKHQLKTKNGASTKSMRRHNVDIMLAATAMATGCTVVSGDQIFSVLEKLNSGLKSRNWLAEN